MIVSKAKNSPFIGKELKGRVKYTIVNGNIVYKDEGGNIRLNKVYRCGTFVKNLNISYKGKNQNEKFISMVS